MAASAAEPRSLLQTLISSEHLAKDDGVDSLQVAGVGQQAHVHPFACAQTACH